MKTERLLLRSYQAGDGPMLYTSGLRHRDHLSEFESGNVLMSLKDGEHAEAAARELGESWAARESYFIGLFERTTNEWIGQVSVGPTAQRNSARALCFQAGSTFTGE